MEMTLRHQNFMLAVRQQMGWPPFKPANDCIGFSSGKQGDVEVGLELGRIARMLGKDMVYSGWASPTATEPTGFCVAYRMMFSVDFYDRLVPFVANDTAPLILVSTRADEHFAIDRRGLLVRIEGKPKAIGKGRKLAMKRIRAAAATMGDELLASNRFVPTGQDWIEPDAVPLETIVRFG
jgi:hypothetical protein